MKKACKGGSAGEDEFEGGALNSQITTFDGYSKNMAVIFIDRLVSNQGV